MGETTEIAWCDHTFNPWWGCTRVSPGCTNCYAETFSKRTGHDVWGRTAPRRFFGDKHWRAPLRWNARAEADGIRRRVFCASMADVFEDNPALDDARADLWAVIRETPHLDWLLLTKRPENIPHLAPGSWWSDPLGSRWPANVWMGTTVEDQDHADLRIPQLLEHAQAAPVKFLSCEPLLGPVELNEQILSCWCESHEGYPAAGHDDKLWECGGCGSIEREVDDPDGRCVVYTLIPPTTRTVRHDLVRPGRTIDWVIVGGESGNGHRPFDPDWARRLRDECEAYGTAFFFKQHGGRTPKAGGDELDGRRHHEFPRVRR